MQQYMIQIINNLEKRGYRRLNPDSNNVYGRTDGGDAVYVVVIGSNRDLGAEQLKRFNDKIVLDLSMNLHKKIKILNILMVPTGMFDDATKNIVGQLDNVWLFTEDYGKLYIFENQPADFDGLYEIIDKQTLIGTEKSRRDLRKMFGVVTPFLVALNVIVYMIGKFGDGVFFDIPLEYSLAINVHAIAQNRQYYRLLTSVFTHFGFAHLFGNMVILTALGARVENIVGRVNYVVLYLIAGLVASGASYINCYNNMTYDYAAGASGAIFGLLGILCVIAIFNKGRVKDLSLMNMIILFAMTVADGFLSEGIDNVAHISGFIAGVLAGVILMLTNQKVVNNSHI